VSRVRREALIAEACIVIPFHDQNAEDLGVRAWRAVDSFTSQSVASLRQEYRTLLEMQDMIARALKACEPQGGEWA
jgi:hypothetical protein